MPDDRRREYPVGVFLVVIFLNLVVVVGTVWHFHEGGPLKAIAPERIVPNNLTEGDPEQHLCSDHEIQYYTRSKITGELIDHHINMKCPLCGLEQPEIDQYAEGDGKRTCKRCGLEMEARGNGLDLWCKSPMCDTTKWRH